MTTIALIDEHPIARTGLSLLMKNNFDEVVLLESEGINTLRALYPIQVPELIILGICLSSNMNRIQLVSQTKNLYPMAHVIIYDEMPADLSYRFPVPLNTSIIRSYLRTGVNGYVTKESNPTELVDCVRAVLKGKRFICKKAFDLLLDMPAGKTMFSKVSDVLTSREYEVAGYLTDGMKTSVIAQRLGRKASTISTIKKNIFKKLEVDSVVKLRNVMVPDQATIISSKRSSF